MAQVKLTDTTLRDAHQSLIATRMRTRDMLPIAEKLDEAGFFSLCLLYTSDAADEGLGVDLGGRRIIAGRGRGFCLLYTSPSPRDQRGSRMPSSA